jgi:tetratricopeptide (TPR) repeat protein
LEWFEILCAQTKFREAIGEAEQFAKRHPQPALDLAVARALYGLGEKEKALAIFDRYAAEIKEGTDASWFGNLMEAEYRLGLHDRAFDHYARVLAVSKDPGWQMRTFPTFFPGQADVAEVWWGILLPHHSGKESEALRQLRSLLAGTLPAKDVTQLVEGALLQKAEHPDRYYLALAEVATAAGLEPLALRCWEQAPSHPTNLTRRGDLLAAKAKWDEAANLYRRAWEAAPEQPLSLYLAGRAQLRAGQEDAGRKLIEQAHLLPLGDDEVRIEFAQALSRRGEREDARREYELVTRLSEAGGFLVGEALRQAAFAAAANKEWTAAAAGQEKAMLRCLRASISFQYASAYVSLPALVHRMRASAALAAGNMEETRREIALCQAAQPGNVETAIALVPELQRKGHAKDAAELFEHTLAPWEKVCDDYPRCAEAHNSAAWLSACCRSNLDSALAHALKAVELEPGAAGFHDTLAEIYFQRGDKEKALAEQKKAIELNPKREYFRKQLRRIEAGDPTAELPTAEG